MARVGQFLSPQLVARKRLKDKVQALLPSRRIPVGFFIAGAIGAGLGAWFAYRRLINNPIARGAAAFENAADNLEEMLDDE